MARITIILIILLGLCLGSFVHVAISRFSPDKAIKDYLYDITVHRSKCGFCQKRLPLRSLIPVISWLSQKGLCRYCFSKIPINYLLAEIATSIFCLTIFNCYSITVWSVILLFLGLYFTVLTAIDVKYLLLPDYFTYPLMLMGLVASYFQITPIIFSDALIGIISGYLLLWLPATSYYLIKKQTGLGGGDIKLLSALGTWIHFTQLPFLLLVASFIGICYFMLLHLFAKQILKTTIIPFGPCLLFSAYSLLLFYSIEFTSFTLV